MNRITEPLCINCGSEQAWTSPDGQIWLADIPVGESGDWSSLGGGQAPREADLPLYPDQYGELLRTERVNPDSYTFVLAPGQYCVELIVAETFEALSAHTREFSVSVNGEVVAGAVTPFKVGGGHGRAGIVRLDGVLVGTDGALQVAFGERSLLNGMRITQSDRDALTVSMQTLCPEVLASTSSLLDKHTDTPIRVLFIGHSGTFFWAIPETVQRMCALASPAYALEIGTQYSGGKNCKFFFEWDKTRERLSEGWDYVIIQDSSRGPIDEPGVFAATMPQLIQLVKDSGAEPILYAYSCPEVHTPAQRQGLFDLYVEVGLANHVPVVPCALAIKAALAQYPDQNFHNPDRHHSGMLAGYLFACVFFSAFTGQSAADLPEYSTLAGHVTLPDDWGRALGELASRISRDFVPEPILDRTPVDV